MPKKTSLTKRSHQFRISERERGTKYFMGLVVGTSCIIRWGGGESKKARTKGDPELATILNNAST